MKTEIAEIVLTHGGLSLPVPELTPEADLFALGMSSYSAVQVMLELEGRFDIRFPDELLKKEHFSSIDRLATAVEIAKAAEAVA